MEQAIQLFGFLILTFLGIVVPILVILLSIFREGIQKLTTQYENEKNQSEDNLKDQFKQKTEVIKAKLDVKEMKGNLKELNNSIDKLEKMKKTAEKKLSSLNPKKQILNLFIPLLISFLSLIAALITKDYWYCVASLVFISALTFTYSVVVLWRLLNTLIEVRETLCEEKQEKENRRSNWESKTIEIFSGLLEKETPNLLKEMFLEDIHIMIDDSKIKDAGEIKIGANKKQEIKVGIINSETRMAKNVEIGFCFPPDFIIEKTNYYSIYTGKKEQIVRYTASTIQGDTNLILSPLITTPLKTGIYSINTFIKAENIEVKNHRLNIEVTPKPVAEISQESEDDVPW